MGIGLFISTIFRTQFQAMQATIMILLLSHPAQRVYLPGGVHAPAGAMGLAVLPLTCYLRIVRGIIVKGVGMDYLWLDTLIIAVTGVFILLIASSRVRKTQS